MDKNVKSDKNYENVKSDKNYENVKFGQIRQIEENWTKK